MERRVAERDERRGAVHQREVMWHYIRPETALQRWYLALVGVGLIVGLYLNFW